MTTGLLSTDEVAAILKLTRQALAIMRIKGRGPRYVKLGRRVLYDPADLTSWIEANKRVSTADMRHYGEI